MRKDEREYLKAIYCDCISLRRRGELTDFGEGQLALCKTLLEGKREREEEEEEKNVACRSSLSPDRAVLFLP